MPTPTISRKKDTGGVTVIDRYDVSADAKKRISLRNAKTKHFHVQALSDGRYLLEPRVLVPPQAVSARTRRLLEQSVANLKQGLASPPIDLTAFGQE